ncbi:hypothetical protein [Demequina mangrovi]|uniref:Cell division protein FtsL n=1 Tax=Demequina mangrovi TaxID=1043493 RepID=A0A1H6Z0T8_9MICO|nr:hypothetical protein [Demequina mangrovi]SEJ47081.1 hypothetical protein SAMN05421637_1906 [Demequina mangrovi]
MSAALRQQRQSAAPRTGTATRPRLSPVAMPETNRPLALFAWLCGGIVILALGAVLLINTTMAEGAETRRSLRIEIADLHQQQAALLETLDANAAPESLAARAGALGMAPATALGFMSLSDGIVLETGKK